ncbi:MAG TPA: thioredoxin family protein [Kofleriaceae bacterium]|nr:thioredoxin family protein [Kofleriaceae bacterium]
MKSAAACLLVIAACGTAARPAPPPPPAAKVVQVNRPGEPVALDAVLVAGHVTVIDFWAEWCGGCKVVEDKLMAAIAAEPSVVVRKIDVGDGETPVARQYQVGVLPHLRIYDREGRLRFVLAGNDALTAGEAALQLVGGHVPGSQPPGIPR